MRKQGEIVKFLSIKKEATVNILELVIQAAVICVAIYSFRVSVQWWWAQQIRPF